MPAIGSVLWGEVKLDIVPEMADEASALGPGRQATDGDAPRFASWVTSSAVREAALASAGLALLAVLVFAPHVRHGGFYLDDWADAAAVLYPTGGGGIGHVLSHFANMLSYCRPVLIVLVPAKYALLGTHMRYYLALTAAIGVAAAILAYGVLRVLRVPWYHAGLIAALTIVYPWYDSTRLWGSASLSTIAVVVALAGLLVALVGLSRDSWRLHAVAVLLYLGSVLIYELTLPVIAAAGLLYLLRDGWQKARFRWAADLVAIGLGGLWDWAHTPRAESGLAHYASHLWEIVTAGGELLGRTLWPLGPHGHTALSLGALFAIAAAGVAALAVSRASGRSDRGWGVREWLLLGAGGLIVTALGWAMLIPANSYFTPSIYGFTNRVNGVAGFGMVIAVYAALGLFGSLAAPLFKRPREAAVVLTLVLGIGLGAAYIHVLERHERLWDAAFQAEAVAISRLEAAFPRLPHHTTVFAGNYPAYLTLGVPIFAATWDFDGMVKLRYRDGTLDGYPVTPELTLVCARKGVRVQNGAEMGRTAPYGTARLLDLSTGMHSDPRSQRACRAMRDRYPPGPLGLSGAY